MRSFAAYLDSIKVQPVTFVVGGGLQDLEGRKLRLPSSPVIFAQNLPNK
jgi:hypothetical protein